MGTTILGAVIGAVVAAPLTLWLQYLLPRIKAKREGIPNIVGQWEGEWYVEANGAETPYIKDVLDIEKQSGFKVFGRGKDNKGTYMLTGKFSAGGIVCFTYEYEKTPNLLTGVVILKIDALVKKCVGRWYGYTKEDTIQGGKVTWSRVL